LGWIAVGWRNILEFFVAHDWGMSCGNRHLHVRLNSFGIHNRNATRHGWRRVNITRWLVNSGVRPEAPALSTERKTTASGKLLSTELPMSEAAD